MNDTLSVLVPARNEEWLSNTVNDLLSNIEGDTEILVGLDGYWPEPGIVDHPRVKILHVAESIGQRAMQNRLAKMSKAKYVMKLDAHCAMDKGFDVKMMSKMEDDVTMTPVLRNLHVFSWKCKDCGQEQYQGPLPEGCANPTCPAVKYEFERIVKWIAKPNPQSSAFRFNKNLQFNYFPELRAKQPRTGLAETMSLQGSCFMATRKKYWELELCDETWGSWGQQGSEVAIKTKLSGGRVFCNMDTWYAHLFRTQHGFSFPYPMSGKSQQRARDICKDIFVHSKWDKQIYPLSKILDEFWFALKEVRDNEQRWTMGSIDRQKARECQTTRSGIYAITSKATNRVYIGSAINIANRIFEHTRKLKQKDHRNVHLQRTYDKYGADDLIFSVLYFCSQEDLIKYEQQFFDEYKTKIGWDNMFNISPTAGNTLGRECSEETKAKISASKIGTASWNKGLTAKDDERIKKYADKIRGQNKWDNKAHPRGMLGKQHSDEIKQQISQSMQVAAKNRDRGNNGQFTRKEPTKGMVYYTHNQLKIKVARKVQDRLRKISQDKGIPIVSCSLKPMENMGRNIRLKMEPGKETMFRQILTALENSTTEYVFFTEHDVLYHPSHFDFTPPAKDKFYFNHNVWKVREDGKAVYWEANQVAEMCCARQLAIEWYRDKLKNIDRSYEPGGRDKNQYGVWFSEYPNIDLRGDWNMTKSKWSPKDFRDKSTMVNWKEGTVKDIPGWSDIWP